MTDLCATLRRLLLLLLVPVVAACTILGDQPPTNFFVLTSMSERPADAAAAVAPAGAEVAVGIAPVEFPAYLERREIIKRSSSNELVIDRFYQWASPLRADFERVLAADLGTLLPTRRAVVLPFRRAFPLDYEVRMTVDRFERQADGTVVLEARWVVIEQLGERTVTVRDARIRVPAVVDTYPAIVEAMSRAVGQLAAEVAHDIRAAPPPPRRVSLGPGQANAGFSRWS
ncbi:MAG: PqiC family protein [Rhodospirillales bacterium]|jgi:hypothetical protein|nr:PqiC family protein [Rhodospirillales bacterium]